MKNARGFTIVELLIVIVVIGILAAIVIVSYVGVQARANDSVIQADLKNMAKKIEQFRVLSASEVYPLTATDLTNTGIKASKDAYMMGGNNLTVCVINTPTPAYAVVAQSKSGKAFYVSNTNGGQLASFSGTAATNCTNAGVVADSPGVRSWGYSNSGWSSWVG